MGQRHQIFVKIINPTATFVYQNACTKEQAEKEFGLGEFSILAYHNQWLYGRSALLNCVNLLNFSKQFTKDAKTKGTEYGSYGSPVTIKGIDSRFFTPEKLTTAIGFIMNYIPKSTGFSEAGIGNSFYIGGEDEGINFNFMLGDNNDGITIIDCVENKYCFMNFFKNEPDDVLSYSASDLPCLKPVDARAYVSAYYGETIKTTNPYYFGDHDRGKLTISLAKQQKIVNDNIKENNKIVKLFNGFEVLTIGDIKKMFPQMKELKKLKEFA